MVASDRFSTEDLSACMMQNATLKDLNPDAAKAVADFFIQYLNKQAVTLEGASLQSESSGSKREPAGGQAPAEERKSEETNNGSDTGVSMDEEEKDAYNANNGEKKLPKNKERKG